jgi:hypothetical protein
MRKTRTVGRATSPAPGRRVGGRRGFTFEEPLALAVCLGCFVYPVALGARAAGEAVAEEVEEASETLLMPR